MSKIMDETEQKDWVYFSKWWVNIILIMFELIDVGQLIFKYE